MVEKKVYEMLTLFDTSVNVNCVVSGYVCKVIVDILVKDDLIKYQDNEDFINNYEDACNDEELDENKKVNVDQSELNKIIEEYNKTYIK